MADQLLIFSIDHHRFGVRLDGVARVVRMPAITGLPGAPDVVRGIINVAGRVIPVVDLRRRFGLPAREARIEDHLVLAHTRQREVALPIDHALGIEAFDAISIARPDTLAPGLHHIAGVARLAGGLVFIHDLDTFLAHDEVVVLDAALAAAPPP